MKRDPCPFVSTKSEIPESLLSKGGIPQMITLGTGSLSQLHRRDLMNR